MYLCLKEFSDVLFVRHAPHVRIFSCFYYLTLLHIFLWYSTELGSNWYLGNEGVEGKALLRRGKIFQVYTN